jgi:hypothetical protein
LALRGRNILLLAVNESPNLIDLYALASQVAENPVLIPRSGLPIIYQKPANSLLAGTS